MLVYLMRSYLGTKSSVRRGCMLFLISSRAKRWLLIIQTARVRLLGERSIFAGRLGVFAAVMDAMILTVSCEQMRLYKKVFCSDQFLS